MASALVCEVLPFELNNDPLEYETPSTSSEFSEETSSRHSSVSEAELDCPLHIDPSQMFRPELDKDTFRIYTLDSEDEIQKRVRQTYRLMHTFQTVDFVKEQINYWTKFNHAELTVMEALEKLTDFIDESDPDVDIPNIVHAFQTAERIREVHPDNDWFHLTGLIHDLGKVMGMFGESRQWAIVGDTFVVGCQPSEHIVYRETSFDDNPDLKHPVYGTKHGIYEPNCGLDNLFMSWGHDEYLYRVLKNHPTCTLPEESLYMIRFHSFYPWHTSNDYKYFESKKDKQMLEYVREFNKFDLYSKGDSLPDIEALKPYYQSLIDKYIPGLIKW